MFLRFDIEYQLQVADSGWHLALSKTQIFFSQNENIFVKMRTFSEKNRLLLQIVVSVHAGMYCRCIISHQFEYTLAYC